ncbi:DNA polymerase III subunit delta [Brevibacterium album]|uniref:DNA polymerase III subunit delta n=1 Tax=Brevibacterium album TaxID=417948 RepID=UPI00040DC768|nr:DNA polymerase III subunit delta [Brevibacterium album]
MAAAKKKTVPWHRAAPAPLVLLSGGEDVLLRNARTRIVTAVRRKHPDIEPVRLSAASYEPGALPGAAAPSLFSAHGLVLVSDLQSMSDAFLADALAYAADPNPDVVVVLEHRGGNRGAKLLKALAAADAPTVDTAVLKSEADRQRYAQDSFSRAKREITADGLAALMNALGSDLSELDAGVRQLLADTEGPVDAATVDRYYGGRVEATGFKVADAAAAGRAGEALALLRHALATGADPVPVVAAVAAKLRGLAKVQGLPGSSGALAAELGMAPWQVDRAKREMRSWNEVALGRAILAAAEADEAVKGGGRDPEYAAERLVAFVAEQSRVR